MIRTRRLSTITFTFASLVLMYGCGSGAVIDATSPVPVPSANDVKQHDLLLVEQMPRPDPGHPPTSATSSIYSVRADGSNKTILTEDGGTPNWTPDGRILFASARSGSPQVWRMNADGSDAQQLGNIDPHLVPLMPQIGTNGLVVFMGADPTSAADDNVGIWVMQEDGSNLHELTRGMQPSLAPSGTWVAYTFQTDDPYHREIWRIDTDGSNQKQLTFLGDPDYPDANAPNISPDERTVAFFSGKESDRGAAGSTQTVFTFGHRNVATIPADGGERTTLTPCHPVTTPEELDATSDVTGDCVAADNPAWSPDGRWLIFDIGFASGVETWMVGSDGAAFQPFFPTSRGTVRVSLLRDLGRSP